jgi:hypothetical protein
MLADTAAPRLLPAHNATSTGLAFPLPTGHNLAALPDLLPAVIALLGLIATLFVVRTRYRVKHSLYTSVRKNRTRQIEQARSRVLTAAARSGGDAAAEAAGAENALEITFGLISLAAALGLVLIGVVLAIGTRS